MKPLSIIERQENINKMSTTEYDLLIIGGGIVGAGVAREAALRGMSVALVEMQDFSQGTSSRSSKLIHGGIRYLENLQFGLVFEALSERRILFEIAPHLVHPLRFLIPLFKSSRVSRLKMGLGMWLYDALALFEAPQMHESLSSLETQGHVPFIRDHDLVGSFVYSDAYMDDDRLTIETIRSAVDVGACVANFVKAESLAVAQNPRAGVLCRDTRTGQTFQVKAKHVCSTVGPWTDFLGAAFFPDWQRRLRPTKGIHLTFSRSRLPLELAVVMAADSEKRIVFAIPREEMILIGTTDTEFTMSPEEVGTTKADVDYLLEITNRYFPEARLTVNDILASYSGVRPLVHDGAESESATSREHLIFSRPEGITFVVGGKYTTYRAMAQQAVDQVVSTFPYEQRLNWRKANTLAPLNPRATTDFFGHWESEAQQWARRFGVAESLCRRWAVRHGGEGEELVRWSRDWPDEMSLEDRYWATEAAFAVHMTLCLRLEDFYWRRSPLFLSSPNHGRAFLNVISESMGLSLGWSADQTKSEIENLQHNIAKELSWKLTTKNAVGSAPEST